MAYPYRIWHPFTQMARFDAEPKLVVERAEGNRLIDHDGREYIDAVASLWSVLHGHGHPQIVGAIQAQAAKLQHSTLLGISHRTAIEFADSLVRHLPEGLSRVYYSSDGSSAVEVALKMAIQYWVNAGHPERKRIVALDMAYHGDTLGANSLGGGGPFRDPYEPLLFEPLRIPNGYPYRCPWCASDLECNSSCVNALRELLEDRAGEIAALIIEPRVQGAAGMIVAPEGNLSNIRQLCDDHDVLLIADEIATGFGRTGEMFACDLEGVVPDIMTLGKGITGGYLPLSATVTTDRVYDAFYDPSDRNKTLFHGHTYAGNPICCAAAMASLKIFDSEPVLERVRQRAAFLAALLHEVFAGHPWVGEIRQQGLMVGLELVRDRASRKGFPAVDAVGWRVCMAARDRGVFIRPLGDVVIMMPPLSIEEDELVQIAEAVSYGLDEVGRGND
jgi:adenosylmethionine-8-amino-7-oxononanoate aminotransferase